MSVYRTIGPLVLRYFTDLAKFLLITDFLAKILLISDFLA